MKDTLKHHITDIIRSGMLTDMPAHAISEQIAKLIESGGGMRAYIKINFDIGSDYESESRCREIEKLIEAKCTDFIDAEIRLLTTDPSNIYYDVDVREV
jgi:hypothetical protein